MFLVTDDSRLPDPRAAIAKLRPGTGVILRHYNAANRATLAHAIARLCRRRRLVLLVAGADWRLAAAIGAQGLHWPEGLSGTGNLAGAQGWRRRRRLLLTCAAHSPRALRRAHARGADAALVSPVFPTASHPGAAAIGAVRFRLWAARAPLPVIALGGITASTWKRLGPRPAWGAAAISGLT